MKTPHDHTEDAALSAELQAHHAHMVADFDRLSAAVVEAAARREGVQAARGALATWLRGTLVPHAEEEESTSYAAASPLEAGRLLIRGMLDEHVLIRRLAALAMDTPDPVRAGVWGRAAFEVFSMHQKKENEYILPLLVEHPDVSLVAVMGAHAGHHAGGHHGHGDHHG